MAGSSSREASRVYFWDLRSSGRAPQSVRLRRLLKASNVAAHLETGDLVAVKVHFGEAGSTGFVQPLAIKPVVDFLRKSGARPFLTDTNTLYAGERGEAASHAKLAAAHGFDPNVLGAPVIIADGLKGGNQISVAASGTGRHFEHCYLAGDILEADLLLTVSHFKGHELAGFGGALKNLGMGCASRQGKMQQHCGLGPLVVAKRCQGCGRCVEVCSSGALTLDTSGCISIERDLCVGCAACIQACRQNALQVDWKTDLRDFLERMTEYAAVTVRCFSRPVLHLSFVRNVSPDCDCVGFTDAPICPDIGVLGSYDPVALDQACLDLVNSAPVLNPRRLPQGLAPGEDKFKALFPGTQGQLALHYAEDIGLGQRRYELVPVA